MILKLKLYRIKSILFYINFIALHLTIYFLIILKIKQTATIQCENQYRKKKSSLNFHDEDIENTVLYHSIKLISVVSSR